MLIIDAHSLLWRMFHTAPFVSPGGIARLAAYRFMMHAHAVADYFKDKRCCFAWEGLGENWRNSVLSQYKAHRRSSQAEKENSACVERTAAFIRDAEVSKAEITYSYIDRDRFEHWTITGGEGDDVIAWLAIKLHEFGTPDTIYTKDRDMLQLVDPERQTRVCLAMKASPFDLSFRDPCIENPADCKFGRVFSHGAQVRGHVGVTPKRMADFKGLAGDPGDGIPGVKGVGKKTAVRLLSTYGGLDDVIKACESGEEKGKIAERIAENADLARRCKIVAELPSTHFSVDARRIR